MILYPAIDLKDGQCVRVVHGDFSTATVFNEDPADQARIWAQAGFSWLHVIDLNGSAEGRAVNASAVEAILNAVSIPVQLGGGIRSLANVEHWIEAGVSRVILGTAAVRGPTTGYARCCPSCGSAGGRSLRLRRRRWHLRRSARPRCLTTASCTGRDCACPSGC